MATVPVSIFSWYGHSAEERGFDQTDSVPGNGDGISTNSPPWSSGRAGFPTWGPESPSAQAAASGFPLRLPDQPQVRLEGAVIDLDNRLCFVTEEEY